MSVSHFDTGLFERSIFENDILAVQKQISFAEQKSSKLKWASKGCARLRQVGRGGLAG